MNEGVSYIEKATDLIKFIHKNILTALIKYKVKILLSSNLLILL